VVSTDGGRTFGEPVNLADAAFSNARLRQTAIKSATTGPNATTGQHHHPTGRQPGRLGRPGHQLRRVRPVDDGRRHGTVYAVWPTTTSNIALRPSGAIMVSKSTDKGKTWTTSP